MQYSHLTHLQGHKKSQNYSLQNKNIVVHNILILIIFINLCFKKKTQQNNSYYNVSNQNRESAVKDWKLRDRTTDAYIWVRTFYLYLKYYTEMPDGGPYEVWNL
jgi:hypothetical protein